MSGAVSVRASDESKATFIRWMKFTFVGGIGIGVQFAALFCLKGLLHLHYLVATVLAVEVAVIHNFVWHEQFTWADRTKPGGSLMPLSPDTRGAEAQYLWSTTSAALKGCATQMPTRASLARLGRFNLANGAVSILGNVSLMTVLVDWGHLHYLAANAIAITLCSVANFVVSDTWVFEKG